MESFHINDKLSGVKTSILVKVADRDKDAANELFRRRLGELCGWEIAKWNQKREALKALKWLTGFPPKQLAKMLGLRLETE